MQGQSSATLTKEVLIQTYLQWALAVTRPAQFFVFDLNCGCGENKSNGANCLGTGPLVRNALRRRGIQGRMWLCDVSRKSLLSAQRKFFSPQGRLFESGNSADGIVATFVRMDNRDFVKTIPRRIAEAGTPPRTARGIVIADPNGLHVPVREIADCLREAPSLDLVIHLYGLKQVCACRLKHPRDPRMNLRPTVVTSCSEIFRRVGKRTWLVSKPFRATYGRDHVVLFGTNLRHGKAVVALPGRPEIYRCDSPEGRAVIADIDRFSGEAA